MAPKETESEAPSLARRLVSSAARSALALGVALCVLELCARVLGLGLPPRERSDMRALRLAVSDQVAPGLNQTLNPGAVGSSTYIDPHSGAERVVEYAVSSQGMRDREFALPKPPGVLRVLVLGDSVTFGTGVPAEATFPKVVERALAERLPERPVEVLNAGVPATNTGQQVAWFEFQMLQYEPDLVFVCSTLVDASGFGVPRNDVQGESARWIERLGLTSGRLHVDQLDDFPPSFRRTTWLRSHSVLADRLAHELYGRLRGDLELERYRLDWQPDSPGVGRIRRALQRLRELSAEHEFQLWVGMFPFLTELSENYPFAEQHAHMQALCEALGLRYFDLLQPLLGQDGTALKVHPHDRHPGERAHQLVGEWIAERLLEQLAAG